MRRSASLFVVSSALALSVAVANAQTLMPGSKAPALSVKTWYKGTPVKALKSNKTYVVEFWATWCGPCRDSIPHISELAKKNKDVTFIGVSIWEDDKGGNIKKFVTEMGKKMEYNVGYAENKTGMARTWMEPSAQNGIPTAFIIKNNVVQWIGHPMDMETPLKQIKSGKYDIKKAKAAFQKEAAASAAQMANQKELQSVDGLIGKGKYDEAAAKLDAIEKKSPAMKSQTEGFRFKLLAKKDPAAWEAKAQELADSKKPEALMTLCMYALEQRANAADKDNAQKAIDLALGAAGDDDVITYYYGALFYNESKDSKKAVELIDKAIAAVPKNKNYKDNPQVLEALKKSREEYSKGSN